VAAALIMATFRAALRAQRPRDLPLDQVGTRLNRILLDSMDSSRFVTAVYGLLDPGTAAFTFANCGHNPPLLVRAGGACETLAGGGPALGMWPGARFKPDTVTLERGDILVLYTDGVIEVMNAAGEMFGTERLESVLRRCAGTTARELIQAVVDDTQAFASRRAYDDDFTLVIVKREPRMPGDAS
jgi:sigma-B regulation protein RsbU (phosphoserine phosphatase)